MVVGSCAKGADIYCQEMGEGIMMGQQRDIIPNYELLKKQRNQTYLTMVTLHNYYSYKSILGGFSGIGDGIGDGIGLI